MVDVPVRLAHMLRHHLVPNLDDLQREVEANLPELTEINDRLTVNTGNQIQRQAQREHRQAAFPQQRQRLLEELIPVRPEMEDTVDENDNLAQ